MKKKREKDSQKKEVLREIRNEQKLCDKEKRRYSPAEFIGKCNNNITKLKKKN